MRGGLDAAATKGTTGSSEESDLNQTKITMSEHNCYKSYNEHNRDKSYKECNREKR